MVPWVKQTEQGMKAGEQEVRVSLPLLRKHESSNGGGVGPEALLEEESIMKKRRRKPEAG